VEAVVAAGATPRLIDVDPRTLVLAASDVEAAISARTAAVIAVDLHGNLPDMGELLRVASDRGIALIEDAAQAHGATWHGRVAGSFGAASCFSFYPGKNLGAFGDAGAIVTDDAELAARARSLANHGRAEGRANVHALIGRNSRLDALQAAVLAAKLRRLDGWNAARRRVADAYRARLPEAVVPVAITPGVDGAYHQFVVRVHGRDRLRARLADREVGTAVHYPVPCHRQLPYRGFASGPLPAAERAAGEILSLPIYPHLTDDQLWSVCAAIEELGTDGSPA
jgi:dTDP-4-amino-4,6-dideoxygalactose transaminase